MTKNFAEQNFEALLNTYNVYFLEEIERRGWTYLLYAQEHSFYSENLVRDFYDGILDYDIGNGQIRVTMDGKVQMVDLRTISEIVGIPVKHGPNPHLQIIEYSSSMGPACRIPNDAGIMASTCYRNIIVVGRWVCTNITGTSKTSALYAPTLACIYALMTKNDDYCVVHQLFETICVTPRPAGYGRRYRYIHT